MPNLRTIKDDWNDSGHVKVVIDIRWGRRRISCFQKEDYSSCFVQFIVDMVCPFEIRSNNQTQMFLQSNLNNFIRIQL